MSKSIVPKNGKIVRVLAICRISTIHQDERSLDDQEALLRKWMEDNCKYEYHMHVIKSRGSGEIIDTDAQKEAYDLVEQGHIDIVLVEDIGRFCRRTYAHLFCEHCEDYDTRLIALNDHIDTAEENWRLGAFFATLRHEQYNVDGSKRICRSLRNRFEQGGVIITLPWGYIRPEGTKNISDVRKDTDAVPIVEEIFRRLEDGASYASVGDWLNAQNVPTGPYCRKKNWNGEMVRRYVRNPILKGVRQRNRKISKRINKTGKHVCVNAPPEMLLENHCPHLAFIEPERYDRVIRLLDCRNSRNARKKRTGTDPRKGVPRKRTHWPGQHARCGVCGRLMYYGGHGNADHLHCKGAKDY